MRPYTAPFVIPMIRLLRKSAGVLSRLTISHATTRPTRTRPISVGAFGRRIALLAGISLVASIAIWSFYVWGRTPALPQPRFRSSAAARWLAGGELHRRLDQRHELGVLPVHLSERDGAERRVAVLVDREVAQDAVRDVQAVQLRGHVGPRPVRLPDHGQEHLRRLRRVRGVRVRLL